MQSLRDAWSDPCLDRAIHARQRDPDAFGGKTASGATPSTVTLFFHPDRNIATTFQALPGASFVVNGAAQASESALTTASVEMTWRNGWAALATFEGEFSQVTASYAGKGAVRYAW